MSVVNQRYIAAALDTSFRPQLVGESCSERFLRMRHNVFAAVASCVQPSTQDTYATGWRRWVGFCNWFEIDPFLRVVPREWVTPEGEIPVNFRQMAVFHSCRSYALKRNFVQVQLVYICQLSDIILR